MTKRATKRTKPATTEPDRLAPDDVVLDSEPNNNDPLPNDIRPGAPQEMVAVVDEVAPVSSPEIPTSDGASGNDMGDRLDVQALSALAEIDPSVIASLSDRQARFVQLRMQGVPQTEAARQAGYAVPNVAGTKVASVSGVAQILAAHRTSMFAGAKVAGGIALQTHLADLRELREEARGLKQIGVAVTAEVARGKASGLYVHKTAAEQAHDEANAATSMLKLQALMDKVKDRG